MTFFPSIAPDPMKRTVNSGNAEVGGLVVRVPWMLPANYLDAG
jgi:hypothetical protein